MSKDERKIKDLLTRGVENIFVKDELEKKLLSGKKLTVYLGIDPTGPTLHMGHMIPIKKLREFQELGHQVILLMGDFTAMIGDPTDKSAARVQLTRKQVLNNLKKYKKQASKFLRFEGRNKALFKFNSKWLGKMSFADVLQLASHMTVDQMLKRDMFERRMEEGKPIFIHEFMYPLMQGYDSVAMKVDVEVGGNDQTFNMLTGRTLSSQILKKEKAVIAMKLLVDNSGKKMGKTDGNAISFEDSPEQMFGKVMSWSDGMIVNGFELCTFVPMGEIEQIDKDLKNGNNPKDAKMLLAFKITEAFYGDKKAEQAKQDWITKFEKHEIPDDMEKAKISGNLGDTLVAAGVVKSKSDFRRLVTEGAITELESDTKVTDPYFEPSPGQKFKVGKKRFVEII